MNPEISKKLSVTETGPEGSVRGSLLGAVLVVLCDPPQQDLDAHPIGLFGRSKEAQP